MAISNIVFRIVGVTFKNEDGIKRQDVLANVKTGDMVILQREPHNVHDKNAVAVITLYGQIGYVGRDYAKTLAGMMDAGKKFKAEVSVCDIYKNTRYCEIRVDEV